MYCNDEILKTSFSSGKMTFYPEEHAAQTMVPPSVRLHTHKQVIMSLHFDHKNYHVLLMHSRYIYKALKHNSPLT